MAEDFLITPSNISKLITLFLSGEIKAIMTLKLICVLIQMTMFKKTLQGESMFKEISEPNVTPSSSLLQTEIPRLIQDFFHKEMKGCNILILHEDDDDVSDVLPVFYLDYEGVALLNLNILSSEELFTLKMQFLNRNSKRCLNFIGIISGKQNGTLLATGEKLWRGNHKILLIAKFPNDLNFFKNLLLTKVFKYCGQMIVVAKNFHSDFWSIYTPTQFKGQSYGKFEMINTWARTECFWNNSRYFDRTKYNNFEGYNFTVATMPYSPFVIDNDLTESSSGRYRGVEIELLSLLSKHSNFTFHYTKPPDGQWGFKLENDSWTGMIGMVERGEAEIAMSDIGLSDVRLKYVDFSTIFLHDKSELLTPKAKQLPMWQGPIRPFSVVVWTILVASLFTVTVVLFIISLTSSFELRDKWFKSFSNCFLFCCQPLINCSVDREYRTTSGRLLIVFWFVAAMTLSISYTSSLTSFLITPGYLQPIENFEQLVKSGLGIDLVNFGGTLNQLVNNADTPVWIEMKKRVRWFTSVDEIYDRIILGKVVTFRNTITAKMDVSVRYSDSFGQPLVHFTGQPILLEKIAWPLQKDAPYQFRINQLITRMVESGIMDKFFKDVMQDERIRHKEKLKEDKFEAIDNSLTAMKIQHFQGPFFIMFLGCFCGIVILFVEICVYKYYRTKH